MKKQMKHVLLGVLALVCVGVGGVSIRARAASEFSAPPAEKIRPLGEWEGQRRLVMVLHAEPPHSTEGVQGLRAIRKAYLDVIKAALPLVDITVITPLSVDALDFANWIHQEGLGKELREGRLALESFAVDSVWIRDYNVLLARGENSQALYGIDPVYAQNAADKDRFYDDRMAYWLYRNASIRWVRPPLYLDGGNFDTDGEGLCFTSTETLGYNLATRAEIADVFRRWMGCQDTVFLEPIPAESTGHVDMFFKVLSPNLWVLGRFAPRKVAREPTDYLEYLAQAAMEKNAETLRSVLKKKGTGQLVRMAMPHPNVYSHYDWDPSEWDLPRKEGESASPLGKEDYYKKQVGYASYLNSVYLKGARGEVVIVPSYTTDPNDQAAVAIYREAYPRAKVIRMPSDYLIQDEGAAHCVLYAMPN